MINIGTSLYIGHSIIIGNESVTSKVSNAQQKVLYQNKI